MKISQLFTKTSKTAPADEIAKNAQLLIRAGYVYKVMAGVYAYTPLGLRVLENIKQIVREEMNAIGGQELIMTSLQKKETWEGTGRWDDETVDVWFKTKLKDDTDLGLAWSHEEAILEMMQQFVKSYKDLPTSVYQFQTKLRNELRAKSGIMRGREFVMKDLYSLHTTQEDMDRYYDKVIEAYKRCYERFGLGDSTFVTFASGGSFTKFSHEFQTICDAGEDILYVNDDRTIAVNEEVLDDATAELGVDKNQLTAVKSAEVGNIFKFGTEKSEKMNMFFTDSDGIKKPIFLASYGIGITRVMGVIVEKYADDKGLIWPESIAPAKVCLVRIGGDEAITDADTLYQELTDKGIEVLYDDRDERPGAKFADAELMGIPYRVTVSDRLRENGQYEYTVRATGVTEILTRDELIAKLN
ncbi:prolyl-tRNA synthetase [Candidatus Saccharibacteria bacterium RIFCSPHIGHO2_01_FULL_45_15]|nr:MAG: prolyl-tRNA synthetase [Candidatus Saccharibacteria bacterium RIFCSPHIGHO2_01_FULL_45_15]OGL32026.1 MAG: prolyl-tRNA synthetase [Candidatus Saccharibacteria bacterium RIFCSPHIGHO2_12_FULL_44_22]